MAWALAGAGCTGESAFALPTWDAGLPSSEYASVCASWAAQVCAYQANCVAQLTFQWTDLAQCEARTQIDCELRAADPAVVFDPTAVANCRYPTDCSAPIPGLCLRPGRTALGGTCQWDEACASGVCGVQDVSTCGTCVEGIACSLSCPADQTCAPDADGGSSCIVPPSVGEACASAFYICGAGAICQLNGNGGSGVCIPTALEGEACSETSDGPVCFDPRQSLFCDGSQHCRVVLPASYGQPCGPEDDGGEVYACVGWASCEYADTPVCVPPAGDGALCDAQQGLVCLPPARCLGNKCVFPSESLCHPR